MVPQVTPPIPITIQLSSTSIPLTRGQPLFLGQNHSMVPTSIVRKTQPSCGQPPSFGGQPQPCMSQHNPLWGLPLPSGGKLLPSRGKPFPSWGQPIPSMGQPQLTWGHHSIGDNLLRLVLTWKKYLTTKGVISHSASPN